MAFLIILLLFTADHNIFSAVFDDSSEGEESVHSPTVQDYNGATRNDAAQEDTEGSTYQLKHLLYPAYDFPERDRTLLKQTVDQLTQENPEAIQNALQITAACKQLFPFACNQRIFAWHLTSSDSRISVKSFISAFRKIPNEQLVEIEEALRTLPLFFSRSAFNEVNDGYLEGDTPILQKWLNVAATCLAVNEEVSQLIDAKKRFEVAYHLMHFMQYRSKDLIKYYVGALAQNVKKIEDRYYPLYCLSRRLKGHDELQDTLLRTLRKQYRGNFEGLFAKATELFDTIKRKQYVGATAALFINQFVEKATKDPSNKVVYVLPDL